MKIIDFRLRPPAMGFLNARIYTRPDIRNRFTRQLGFEPAPSAEEKSLELMFEEMAAAGIEQGVCVGRNSSVLGSVSNADVAAVAKAYPDKFHPVGSIEAATRKEAMTQMQEILTWASASSTWSRASGPRPCTWTTAASIRCMPSARTTAFRSS